jgi:hypothetical protein
LCTHRLHLFILYYYIFQFKMKHEWNLKKSLQKRPESKFCRWTCLFVNVATSNNYGDRKLFSKSVFTPANLNFFYTYTKIETFPRTYTTFRAQRSFFALPITTQLIIVCSTHLFKQPWHENISARLRMNLDWKKWKL